MDIILRAYLPEDGSGIFEFDGSLRYVEHPYTDREIREVSPLQLERLLHQLDFKPCDERFKSFEALKKHLSDIARAWVNPFGSSKMKDADFIRGLDLLPETNLQFMINDLRTRYVAKGEAKRAKELAAQLFTVQKIRESMDLSAALFKLVGDCDKALAPIQELQNQPPMETFKMLVSVLAARQLMQPLHYHTPGR